MKILVMSDSHGSVESLVSTVALETPNHVLHLGDYDRDCGAIRLEFPYVELRAVRGNCDGGSQQLDVDEFTLDGVRFLMTHGHIFGVKAGITRIKQHAAYKGADVLLFGHTHKSHFEIWERKLHVINPGSMGFGSSKSYAVIELDNGNVKCELRHLAS